DKLGPEIEKAIETATQVLVVLSPHTVNSPWVRREVQKALAVEQRRKADGYRVIPVLLPGITPGALGTWFDEEPVAEPIEIGPTGLSAALPRLLAALGERLPTDAKPFEEPDARPVAELFLTLNNPTVETVEGKRRARATATLVYEPADSGARSLVSQRRYSFTAPLGPIETADLRWYLESYHLWPVGVFQERAAGIEARLPAWGAELFKAALGEEEAREALSAWQNAQKAERRFSVQVDGDLPKGATEEARASAQEAANELLGLPWELLHDGDAWLFQGRDAVRIRRRLPNRKFQPARPSALPLRILALSPRPEKAGYFDHRSSAEPLTAAVESLGALARLTVLQPPTYVELEKALQTAAERDEPFDVVHFDGHGIYDRRQGLGGLCFEALGDRPDERPMDLVYADRLAGLFRRHRIPLVFLDACQTAVEAAPTASVAAKLLDEGVTSVVAMSHSVLVETARRFVKAFYAELVQGARVGGAMLAGQRELFADARRGKILGAGELKLQDWFVPVLYQEEQDPQLLT
ncbi:MAG TPA: hypothetical protein DD490_20200, partial [Acidobacteria bacterium]|nr:hypothetical protein [Acidobacteriota bacterium]